MRIQIEKTRISSHNHEALSITASFGIAEVQNDLKPAIINADKALYRAKANGRNQVVCFNLSIDKLLTLQAD